MAFAEGKCDCELDVFEIFNKAIAIAESFVAQKNPEIFVKINIMKNIEENAKTEVRVHLQM